VPRKKAVGGLIVVALIGVAAVATISESGSSVRTADTGGGIVPPSAAPPAPYAISTLGPIGTAAQDPGGGGGGTGAPGSVGAPGIQGSQGSGSAQGPGGNDSKLYLSGSNLIDPGRSDVTSGSTAIPNTLAGVAGALPIPGGGTQTTGCATDAQSADYYAIPLHVETVGFRGTPSVRIHISGAGPVTVRLEQQSPGGSCQTVDGATGQINGGIAEFSLGSLSSFQFTHDFTPALVISAPGSHTITTGPADPSYIFLPGLYGV
jgi:hypothetical protein